MKIKKKFRKIKFENISSSVPSFSSLSSVWLSFTFLPATLLCRGSNFDVIVKFCLFGAWLQQDWSSYRFVSPLLELIIVWFPEPKADKILIMLFSSELGCALLQDPKITACRVRSHIAWDLMTITPTWKYAHMLPCRSTSAGFAPLSKAAASEVHSLCCSDLADW